MAVYKHSISFLITTVLSIGFINMLFAQEAPLQKLVTVKAEQQNLTSILENITTEYSIEFSYRSTIIKDDFVKNIDVKEVPLHQVLSHLLKDFSLQYKNINGVIVIFKKDKNTISEQKKKHVYGYLTDKKTGKPIANVNVFISNTTIGTATDQEGYYQIPINKDGIYEMVFSHVSYFHVIKFVTINSGAFQIVAKFVTLF